MNPKEKDDEIIELTNEELDEIFADDDFDNSEENGEIRSFYFSNPDPYAKVKPRPDDAPKREFSFDDKGNIVVKNPSAYWLPDIKIVDEHGGTEYTVEDVLRRVRRCKPYIYESGGVTVTGGEPLAQPVFTAALLLALLLNFVLKKNSAKESSTTPVTETGNAAETETNTEQSEEAQAQTAQSDNAATEADGGEKASDEREESLSAAAPALSPSQPPAPKKRLLYCRHCGFRTESIYSTCPRCSNEMTEILICPNCRTETYGVFCGNCGTKVKK